jgi:hypothetical protein
VRRADLQALAHHFLGKKLNWRIKARIFHLLSVLPFGFWAHYEIQRLITREIPRNAETLDALLSAAKRIASASRLTPAQLCTAHFLEIGSGRDLAVAIALRMLGVGKVTCTDINSLAKLPMIRHAINHFAARLTVPAPRISSWRDLAGFGIDYLAPQDLRLARINARTIDCFYSVDTLEHIPTSDLVKVLEAAARMLTRDGMSIHLIDYSDHYARGQPISRVNFLKFSEAEWRPFNSSLQYVNRLRHSEYVKIFEDTGFSVLKVEVDHLSIDKDILRQLAPQFKKFDPLDLFTLRAIIVSRVKGTA